MKQMCPMRMIEVLMQSQLLSAADGDHTAVRERGSQADAQDEVLNSLVKQTLKMKC